MATATSKATGFKVTCPFCNDTEAALTIDLNDPRAVSCSACDETFSPRQAAARLAEQVKRWESVARWLDQAGWMEA